MLPVEVGGAVSHRVRPMNRFRALPVLGVLSVVATLGMACGGSEVGSPTSPTSNAPGISSSIAGDPAPLGTASISGPANIGARLQPVSCTQERSLRSTFPTPETRIEFVNFSSSPRRIYWLSYTGERVRQTTIASGNVWFQRAFLTHPFVVTDEADTCIGIYMPVAEHTTAVIEDARPVPALAAVAPAMALELYRTVDLALRAGAGIASLEPVQREMLVASLLRLLLPTPVYAQTFGGFAPCRNAGSVRITGDATPSGRRISLNGVRVSYSTCTFPLPFAIQNGVVTFSGSMTASGAWTADEPGNRVTMVGSVDVNGIGPVSINCSSMSLQDPSALNLTPTPGCNGNVGGITVGSPDAAPPANPAPPTFADFDGSWSGAFTGDSSGTLELSVANGTITVIQPSPGTGTIDLGFLEAQGAFVTRGDLGECTWTGPFLPGGARQGGGSGPWTCHNPNAPILRGTWTAARGVTPPTTPPAPSPTPTPSPSPTPTPNPAPAPGTTTVSPITVSCRNVEHPRSGFIEGSDCSANIPMTITTAITSGTISVKVLIHGASGIETRIIIVPNTAPGNLTAQIPVARVSGSGCGSIPRNTSLHVTVVDGPLSTFTSPGGRVLWASNVAATLTCSGPQS